jgi:hypothetical protein
LVSGGLKAFPEETMKSMRNEFLAAAAAVALIAATGGANAQSGNMKDTPGVNQGSSSAGGGGATVQGKGSVQTGAGGAQAQSSGNATVPGTRQGEAPAGGGTAVQGKGSAQTGNQMPRDTKTQAQERNAAPTPQGEAQTGGGGTSVQGKSSAQAGASDKPAQLSETQRTQISTTVSKQSNLRRVERTKINFTINVGAVVPRTVNLAPLPAPILAVVPAYRGYLYIVVGDDLLIVHPRTYEIVAVIPA